MPPRLPARPSRPIPWKRLIAVGVQIWRTGKARWDGLSKHEQSELVRILRKARNGPAALSERERTELRRIVLKAAGFGR